MNLVVLRSAAALFVAVAFVFLVLQPANPLQVHTIARAYQPDTPDPNRQVCGIVSLVLPPGVFMNIETEPNGGYMLGTIFLAEGKKFEIFYTGGQEMYPGYAEEPSLKAQTERWRDSLKDSTAAGPTPEVHRLQGGRVYGYYCLVEHDLNTQPPNEYVRNTWPTQRFSLRGFFALQGNVVAMGGTFDDPSGETAAQILEIIKTARWTGV